MHLFSLPFSAGIFKAKQVVVLADASAVTQTVNQQSSGSAAGLDALVDADAIFCYQCVRKMNEQAHVVVEIVRHTNVGYLDPESGLNCSDIDYKFTPQFASGALFATSQLDTLVCQVSSNISDSLAVVSLSVPMFMVPMLRDRIGSNF